MRIWKSFKYNTITLISAVILGFAGVTYNTDSFAAEEEIVEENIETSASDGNVIIGVKGYDYSVSPESVLSGIKDWSKGRYPVFIKPSNAGSSFGISKVRSEEGLKEAVEKALKYDTKVIVERGIDAREIECAVLGEKDDIFVSILGEIVPSGDFYDYGSKYGKKTLLNLNVNLPSDLEFRIKDIAKKAYVLLGCSGLSRVDFFLEKGTEKIFLNEINTFPGFTESSMYPKLMNESGFSFEEVLEKLIDFAKKKRAVRSVTE